MQKFFADVIVKVLSDPKVQQFIKNMLGSLITERILPLVPVAAASAGKAAVKELIENVPELRKIVEAAGHIGGEIVDVANIANDVRNDLNRLIPDFDTGVPQIDQLMDFWRPR